jgi:hypothetical protein
MAGRPVQRTSIYEEKQAGIRAILKKKAGIRARHRGLDPFLKSDRDA